jgi:hypothetical protein
MNRLIPSKENEDYKMEPDRKNEMPYYANEFVVYGDYAIILGDEDAWGNMEVSVQATTDQHKIFNPNTYPEHLYLEIAKIKLDIAVGKFHNEKNEIEEFPLHRISSSEAKNSLLKFCKRFGLLGISDRGYSFKRVNEEAFTKGYKKIVLTDVKEDLINQDLIDGVFRMEMAVSYLNRIVDGTITEKEEVDLGNIITDELPFKQDRVKIKNGKSYPSILFSSLIDLAWWQLFEALRGGTEYKHCKNDRCGNIFAVTHGNRHYCPHYPGQKRSNCETAYNKRLKNMRIKQAIQNKTQN